MAENEPQQQAPPPAASGATSSGQGAPAGAPMGGQGHSGGFGGRPGGPRPQGGPRPPGGPKRGKRNFVRKKKVCRFCVEKIDLIDYKKAEILSPFIQDRGRVLPRRMTGTCARHQRWLTVAIKRAQNIALLPFAAEL
ncbi:MAG TPA: 30S ribosomal protein S18 [Candidatus Acidoferrales bacterium]|nr:30S ribosomal protein S18 [Candidatus Acidoferrales bacterium]